MFGDSPPIGDSPQEPERPAVAELEAAGQAAMFGDPAPASPPAPAAPQPSTAEGQAYRVLARKYRPQTFSQLIGQEPMVRTLGNAIARGRLAHAFLMTGVRGVGKTSTARLIAKALNCVGPDGQGGPTIDPCGQCEPCRAIAEGRHIDVIEMDAASHTGVNDVREIIEAVRYAAVSARYKIYIIDEVHMLSNSAFNALLKTLEEPPAHVKFLFATTEVDKLPVTVLSRTQRFDLRRIPAATLREHFASICRQEGVEAEDEALGMVAAAAEGSVRDGLSILDQAIAHADADTGGVVTEERVRDMLGLADKSARRRLFASLLGGEAGAMLDEVERQYALGVDPLALVRSLMDLTHQVAVTQVGGGTSSAPTLEERADVEGWAARLSPGQVHRLWQLLLKGHDEVRAAPDPLASAQMALLRVTHAADLPDPGTLASQLSDMLARAPAIPAAPAGEGSAPAAVQAEASVPSIDWAALCDQVEDRGRLRVANLMRDWLRVVELAPGRLVYQLVPGIGDEPTADLRDALREATGIKWQVERGEGEGAPSLREEAESLKHAERERVLADPLVQAAFAAFPGAELIEEERAPAGVATRSRAQ
ncbi:DNA polymerase III subunit gamma/tau [Croceibacterium mercuriale]|uniref:DNA polymerase III subunit gamma/tau n=1 Tax=Croceibacterium mercuriale TaxID=1572751 RepID=A0A0B2C3T0_9SPHN|nr:DNA polymerase III subunit gamma/tau [Croceibacterium mercuriale]KHL26810.1 DNA polymerase III subunit gamma/tau [Croceibacterium mercuriale]